MESLQIVNGASLEEHFGRAQMFLRMSQEVMAEDRTRAFRLAIASIYFARAIADQLLAEAEDKGSRTNPEDKDAGRDARREFDTYLAETVAYFKLVDYARLQDFHRRALMPPVEGRMCVTMQGPATAISRQGGLAGIQGIGREMRVIEERNSSVKLDRPVQQRDDELLDDKSNEWIPIHTILTEYLRTIRPVIDLHVRSTTRQGENGDEYM